MNFIDRARAAIDALAGKSRSGPVSVSSPALGNIIGGTRAASGKAVTDVTALQLGAAWACVRLNSEAAASLPLQAFERTGNGGRREAEHPIADLIASPNAEQTTHEFMQGMLAWLWVRGNAYAEVSRLGDRIVSLNPVPTPAMQVTRNSAGELRYAFNDRGKRIELPAENCLHIRGFGTGGDLGLSPIQYGVNALGSALSADEAAGSVFANGLSASGFLTTPDEVKGDQREQLTEHLKDFSGSSRAGKVMILEAGVSFVPISLSPEDTQLLETRRFGIEEVCRWFGTPPIMVGHAGQGQTMWGTGVEAILLQWLTTGLNPVLRRVESRITRQLLKPEERRRFYFEFNREALLQADSATKAAFLSTMVQNALMTRNEARAKLNLPAKPGGDELTAQTNLAPLAGLAGTTDATAAKAALKAWLES